MYSCMIDELESWFIVSLLSLRKPPVVLLSSKTACPAANELVVLSFKLTTISSLSSPDTPLIHHHIRITPTPNLSSPSALPHPLRQAWSAHQPGVRPLSSFGGRIIGCEGDDSRSGVGCEDGVGVHLATPPHPSTPSST